MKPPTTGLPFSPNLRRARRGGLCALAPWLLLSLAGAAGAQSNEPIVPLPASVPVDPDRAALGGELFADERLSGDRQRSCASCHPLDRAGVDGLRRAPPADGRTLLRNTPTVFNVAFNAYFNWDGGTDVLAEHDARVLRNPAVMAIREEELLQRLNADARYRAAFGRCYADGLTLANVLDAIVTFERTLVTPDSRFDRFLRGDPAAITARERHGYQLFRSLGCVACHQGRNIGGNVVQRFGVFEDTSSQRAAGEPLDDGRFLVTGDPADHQVFRVPSLRNVAVTGPYFHDGRAPTLPMAVATMARAQLGRPVPQADIDDIVAFLGTLTGRYRGRELQGYQ